MESSSGWSHEPNNFLSDNDYEKEFESYISDVDDDDGEYDYATCSMRNYPFTDSHFRLILIARWLFCLSISVPFLFVAAAAT